MKTPLYFSQSDKGDTLEALRAAHPMLLAMMASRGVWGRLWTLLILMAALEVKAQMLKINLTWQPDSNAVCYVVFHGITPGTFFETCQVAETNCWPVPCIQGTNYFTLGRVYSTNSIGTTTNLVQQTLVIFVPGINTNIQTSFLNGGWFHVQTNAGLMLRFTTNRFFVQHINGDPTLLIALPVFPI